MKLKDFLMAPEFAIEGFVMWSLSSMHDKCNECMFQAYMHQSNTLNQTVVYQCKNACYNFHKGYFMLYYTNFRSFIKHIQFRGCFI